MSMLSLCTFARILMPADYSDLERLMADARLVYHLGLLTDEELEEIAAFVAEEATKRMAGEAC
jgi:hypothetical protein